MSLIPKVFDSIEAAATGSNDSLFDDSYHTIDVEIFLEINRLSSVKETFLNRNITIEELLDFSETDLRSFAADIGLDTLLSNRLAKAIRNYEPQNVIAVQDTVSTDVNSMMVEADGNMDGDHNQHEFKVPVSNNNEAVQHVIISPEENDCINNISHRYDHTSMLVSTIESSFVTADEACKQCKQEISDKFQHLFLQMKLREEELIAEADDLCNDKKSRLEQQKLSLNEYKILINDVLYLYLYTYKNVFHLMIAQSKQEYEQLITNANLDVNKRKQEVLNMFSAVMTTNISMSIVTQPNLTFKCNPMDIQHFLSALMIDNCDRPSSPILIVNGVTYNSIDIEWKTEFDDQMFSSEQTKVLMYDRQPTEYQICFCKYRKVYSIEQPIKKKKKQKKKKGRKRKRRYSDSESDSSSESSSDSSSDDSSSSSHTYYSSSAENNYQSAGIANDMKIDHEMQEGIGNNNNNERASVNYARKLEQMHWKKILVRSVKKRQITINKLYHGWLYFIRIRAKNKSGWSDYSSPVKIATQTISYFICTHIQL